jgi:hypothetical protein
MTSSNNPPLVTLAINEAHVSADAILQDLVSRAAFAEVKAFVAEPIGEPSPDAMNTYIAFSNAYGLRVQIQKYDPGTGQFSNYGGEGQISGTRLSFRTSLCQGTLVAVQGTWSYEGLIVCVSGGTKLSSRMRVAIR